MNNNQEHKSDILIVDDVPENLQLLFTILTDQGYEVRRVLTGRQAIQAAQIEPPDLILLDIKMPDLDGYEVCKRLKASPLTQDIPIIFLSALNDAFDKVKAFEVGGADYITKPFQLQEVVIRVENQLKLLRMQREVENKNAVLESLNKELEAFSYRISHDLRNPLNNINGFCFLLQETYSSILDEKGKKYINLIYQSGLRMEAIIQDLLRLSQVKYLDMMEETFDLSQMVKEITEQLHQEKPEIKMEVIITPGLTVCADRRLLEIALGNLLENAYKYTGKQDQPRLEFGKLDRDNIPVYFLKDNGIGFDEKKADDLFSPFHRLANAEEFIGTGIGLATVKRIIERHGGKIWYEAEVDQGATFFFTLG